MKPSTLGVSACFRREHTSPRFTTCTNYQKRKFQMACSRLYQRRFLRPNTHFAAFFEIYKIITPSHRSTFKISVENRVFLKMNNELFNFLDFSIEFGHFEAKF